MNDLSNFLGLLSSEKLQIGLSDFVINFRLTAFVSWILSVVYVNFARNLSNREQFANNFILLSVSTMLVISIVQSSLSLSLGLIGALSIVRFRSAIKDPEELIYLFLSIVIGLGFGAQQKEITIISFAIIILIIIVKHLFNKEKTILDNNETSLFLTLSASGTDLPDLDTLISLIESNFTILNLRRLDKSKEQLEVTFWVQVTNIEKLSNVQKILETKYPNLSINLLEDSSASPIFN
ncbi:MAG: DUF4956 domain-containing protein [Candidatus Caenarcaniphilales bacterium]|nr:DUF4956 domain-containing protein [Candidatus Caenarcaniphilales bacterium]